jgi:DNA polymerase III delta prime subunit
MSPFWNEKYRPSSINDCIISKSSMDTLKGMIRSGNIQNIILTGSAGIGKTTIAKALCNDLHYSVLFVNGSISGGIDTLRTTIQDFASTGTIDGSKKCVILDEGDYLSAATQAALRGFTDEYGSNCAFIITCNYLQRIIEPIQSRFSVISLNVTEKDEKQQLTKNILLRTITILKQEHIEIDNNSTKILAQYIVNNFPDIRNILINIQYVVNTYGCIDERLLKHNSNENIQVLVNLMKKKDFNLIEQWIEHEEISDYSTFYYNLYKEIRKHLMNTEQTKLPIFAITCADYIDKQSRSILPKITLLGFCSETMNTII